MFRRLEKIPMHSESAKMIYHVNNSTVLQQQMMLIRFFCEFTCQMGLQSIVQSRNSWQNKTLLITNSGTHLLGNIHQGIREKKVPLLITIPGAAPFFTTKNFVYQSSVEQNNHRWMKETTRLLLLLQKCQNGLIVAERENNGQETLKF